MLDVDRYRDLFPVTEQYIFLEHASIAPVSRPVLEAMNEYLTDVATGGGWQEPRWMARVEAARVEAARLVGASRDEIAFVKNTSEGLLNVANGIRWRAGDNVVLPDGEFPANVYPWKNLARLGVETRFVSAPNGWVRTDDLIAAMDERTRLVTVSFVQYANGFRVDLDSIGAACRERGVLFCVDAIQGLGALRLDVSTTPVDFFAADGHKWLLAPEGSGVFYCRRERLEDLVPVGAGWYSVDRSGVGPGDYLNYDLPLLNNAARFEPGTRNNVGIYGLGAAVELLNEVGLEVIETRVLALTERLLEGLAQRGYEILSSRAPHERSAIVSFRSDRHPSKELWKRLREAHILTSLRQGAIRVAPHFYNTEAEIDAVLETLPG